MNKIFKIVFVIILIVGLISAVAKFSEVDIATEPTIEIE